MPLHVMANFGGFQCECGLEGKSDSLINLLKASLVYGRELKHDGTNKTISRDTVSHVVREDRCLKDYGIRLSQAVDSAERFDSNWSKPKTTTALTSPSLEVTLS
eukprot:Em0022g829a